MAVEHNTLPQEAQHIIHRWKVADETEFNAIVPTIDDLDKIALRVDNDTFYRLKSHDPIEWVALGTSQTVDLSNYYTKSEVDTLFSNIDYSNFYTKSEVDTIISSIPPADLSDYYNKSEVDTLIAGVSGGTVDLSNYYTKSEVDSLIPEFNGLSELPQYILNTEVLTSERWHNGKPIYQKVIDFGVLPNATSKSVAHGITNADVMWLDRGSSMVYVTGTPTTAYGLEFGTNTDIDVHAWSADVSNTSVRMYTYSNRTTFSAYMTIKYTKSTDTANSPVKLIGSAYNISSTEYVLPYTRNGKTVYGIEIDCGNMPNNTTKNVAIPNYNNAYDYDIVKFKASDATYHINVPIQWSATTYIERWITRSSGSLTIVSNFNASSLVGKAVLEYTKN